MEKLKKLASPSFASFIFFTSIAWCELFIGHANRKVVISIIFCKLGSFLLSANNYLQGQSNEIFGPQFFALKSYLAGPLAEGLK